MNIIPFIYIFSLYVLFTPGILFKKNNSVIINALLFAIVLYFTMDFVKQNQEYMSQNTGVDVDGLKDLVNSLNEEIYEKVIKVDVKNEYVTNPATDNSGIVKLCEEKIQDIANYKQQIEDLNTQLTSYAGTRELIASLKNTVSQLEEKKAELMNQLDLANETIANQQSTIRGKDDQIEVLDESIINKDGTIQTKTETIDRKNNTIQRKNNTIQRKNNKIQRKNNRIGHLSGTISGKNNTINSLNGTVSGQNNTINSLNGTINGKNNTINSLSGTISGKNNTINSLYGTISEKDNTINSSNNKINRCSLVWSGWNFYRCDW